MTAKILSLVVLAASMLSASARAQDVCENLDSCRALRAQVDARIAVLEGQFSTYTTATSHIFTRDTSIAELNEAWRDESGMIWGDIVKNDDRSVRYMTQYQASDYCQSIGAQLPSREDFQRLRSYMGARTDSKSGYTPQALPDLYHNVNNRPEAYHFWSSWVHPFVSILAYAFNGRSGEIAYDYRDGAHAVRCVSRN